MLSSLLTRVGINCEVPVEREYYTSKNFPKIHDLCPYCLAKGAIVDAELKKKHVTVLPLCSKCKDQGRKAIVKGNRVTRTRK